MSGCKQSAGDARGQGEGVPACLPACPRWDVPGLLQPVKPRVPCSISAVLFIIRSSFTCERTSKNPFKIVLESVNPLNDMSLEILLLAAQYVDRRGRQYECRKL